MSSPQPNRPYDRRTGGAQPTQSAARVPESANVPASGTTDARSSSEFFAEKASGMSEEVLIRKRKRSHTKRKKRLRIAAIVAAVLVVVIGGVAFAVMHTIESGRQSFLEDVQEAEVETVETAETTDKGKTVSYNGHTYALNENMVSVLIIGFDRTSFAEEGEEAGQSDAMMVVALDTETGETTIISIPRDSMVLVDVYTEDGAFSGQQRMQACLAYSFGDGATSSCENTVSAVQRLIYNIPLTYYFAMDESGIAELNDAIGGVSLTPLQSIPGTYIQEGEPTVLFGTNAYKYVQYRDTSDLNSSLDRQERQMQYVNAFLAQTLEQAQGNVGLFLDLFNIASAYSVTNMGIDQFSFLASCLVSAGINGVSVTTLPGEITQGTKYAEFNVDEAGTYEIILDTYYNQID